MAVTELVLVSVQLLVALDTLKSMNILHTDIKPDIMFTNLKDQPLRVKLIDFGLAIPAADVQTGVRMQPCGYRWLTQPWSWSRTSLLWFSDYSVCFSSGLQR